MTFLICSLTSLQGPSILEVWLWVDMSTTSSLREMYLQHERGRTGAAERQLSSLGRTALLSRERQGQLTPAELVTMLATYFLQS